MLTIYQSIYTLQAAGLSLHLFSRKCQFKQRYYRVCQLHRANGERVVPDKIVNLDKRLRHLFTFSTSRIQT